MKIIERLRELEKAAAPVYEKPTELENDTTNGFRGDVRIWNRDIAGDCVAVFRSSPKARATADHYIATRNALPALLAAVEAAEKLVALRRTDQSLDWLEKELETEAQLDAALRALEGGE